MEVCVSDVDGGVGVRGLSMKCTGGIGYWCVWNDATDHVTVQDDVTDHVIGCVFESKRGLCPEYRVHFNMQMKENKKNKVPQNLCIY